MASPFAPFVNARLAWQRPTAPLLNLRDGVAGLATETVVIEAFVKETNVVQPQDGRVSGDRATVLTINAAAVSGYIVRWVVLPEGASWLDAGSDWEWDESSMRPDGFRANGAELQMFRGQLQALPDLQQGALQTIEIQHVGNAHGDGGIGELVREAVGDQFTALLREAR